MKYINLKKSHSGLSPFLLIFVILGFIFFFLEGIWGEDWIMAFFIYFSLLFLPSLFFFDIFLWHVIGKEIIYTQNKTLIIKKVNRIRPRKKKIRFEKIENISLWEEKGLLRDIASLLSAFWDWDKQGKIRITYDNGCSYYIGRNLTQKEAAELVKMLKSEIPITIANPTLKSKITEWIILGFLILLIAVLTVSILYSMLAGIGIF